MKPSRQRKLKWALLCCLSAALFLSLGIVQLAQNKLPAPTSHVNDFAGVLNKQRREQLENILVNVKLKTGIEFDIAIVESTSGQELADFSLQLAKDWNIGAFTTAKKSLLLVLAVNEKTSLTRFSKSVQRDLPEGVLGEMGQRMRAHFEAGQFGEGLQAGVEHFVTSLSQKLAFSTDNFDQPPAAVSTLEPAAPDNSSSKPTDEAAPAITRSTNEPKATTAKAAIPRNDNPAPRTTRQTASVNDEDDSEEVALTLPKPPEERVVLLRAFLDRHPDSKEKVRATEYLVIARASLGDQRLKKGDRDGGLQQFTQAIADAPVDSSEKLFSGVLSQIPLNLYLRGETAAAAKTAQEIETRFGNDAKRLVMLSNYYVRTEQGGEAIRLATQAVQLSPDLAEAHQGLGLALRVSLRLDEATSEYKRALELDPNSKLARRSLADLNRAFGKSEDALALYRQELEADPKDKAARTGMILSLLDLGRIDEAKGELEKTLKDDPRNLPLLAGTAYWFAAHNDSDSALALGGQAVQIEPRYTWSQIALARALVARKKPLEAERALRFARQYGKFPTLDYELASVLMSAALYEEAAEILLQSFSLKDGQIETRLGGQTAARNANFGELLAPERRASIFQSVAADTEGNAKLLKALLAFATATDPSGTINEDSAIIAAKEFASGDDAALVYRQLYVAGRLLQRGIGFQTAYDLAEAARSSAEAGMAVPDLTLAVQADEFRVIRARAIAAGGTPDIPEAPRNVLSNLLRGRIEDTAGWARFNQDKLDDAVDHLKRAVAILPEGTPAAQTSLWRLGVALERQDKKAEALSYYIRSYNSGEPDPVRRTVIEQLYRKINGSLDGLDERIGRGPSAVSTASETPNDKPVSLPAEPASSPDSTPIATAAESPASRPSPEAPQTTSQTIQTVPSESPSPSSAPPTPDKSPLPSPEVSTTVLPPAPSPSASPETHAATPTPSPTSSPEPTPEPSASPTPEAPSGSPAPTATTVAPIATTNPAIIAITGRVKDASGNPIANVVVVLISPQGTVLASTTDEQGKYSFTVATSPASRSYRAIPSKDGLTFEPVDRVLPILNDDVKEVDFVGLPVKQSVRLR
jgi:tetratricopeptide (TPR) repeat protein